MLVTGADGFTGCYFVHRAEACGYKVHALRSNLLDEKSLSAEILLERPEIVVHLAAISLVAHEDSSAFYQVNVVGTTNLLNALVALGYPLRKVLIASSANVYGNSKKSPISEEELPAPNNHYAMSKLAMEFMARSYLDRLPIFFTRPFNYVGVGQSLSFVIPKIVDHFKKKSCFIELGNLDVEREFNDVRFVCDAYLILLEKANIGEVYNVCTGQSYSLKVVLTKLSEITGWHITAKTNPEFLRKDEIQQLYGNSSRLKSCIGKLNHLPLENILDWMLKGY